MSQHAHVAQAPIQARQKATPAYASVGGILQRKCACGQHTIAGGECDECRQKREGMLQRAAVSVAPTNGVPPIVHDVLNSPGQPLDTGTRTFMEPRFGHDFSQVRVHTDARAAESARAVNALAYTVGRNVGFGTGQYTPGTSEGKRLLAHELTHVVQQDTHKTEYLTPKNIERTQNTTAEAQADGVAAQMLENTSKSNQSPIMKVCLSLQRANEEEKPGKKGKEQGGSEEDSQANCKRHSIPEAGSGPSVRERYRIHICVNTNELFVEEIAPPHRKVFHALVVTGGEGTPTPLGRFHLGPWERDYTTPKWGWWSCTPWSERPGFNVFGPYITRFQNGYFLHGTAMPSVISMPWINIAGALPAGGSHGCIRMNNVDLVSLHNSILSNPKGTEIVIENCTDIGPAEATSELRFTVPFIEPTTGKSGLGFEAQYRRFTPTLFGRRAQPFYGATLGTEGLGIQTGLTVEPFTGIGLYLEGKMALRSEWFQRVEVGGGAEVGIALNRSRSLRLGISWDFWQSLTDDKKRSLLATTLGFRF
jgi:Domain of unknown function (DUF4157)/L,D-transpeptidase catalytic domain